MTEQRDGSTKDVKVWLGYVNKKFTSIYPEDEFEVDLITPRSIKLRTNQKAICLEEINSYWYRRGELRLKNTVNLLNFTPDIRAFIIEYLRDEATSIKEYVCYKLSLIKKINHFEYHSVNKIIVLDKALNVGLTIPKTYIAASKDVLNDGTKFITKAIKESFRAEIQQGSYMTYTEKVNEIPSTFFPTLLQELIEKEADIRIFYLKGKCYSMAIRSQNDKQTTIDFRKYNQQKPNRKFPFKLPDDVESKIHLLMKDLDLESGSIDMVFTQDGEFVFLEVNPIGQFGMTSYPCNYYLEKILSKSL